MSDKDIPFYKKTIDKVKKKIKVINNNTKMQIRNLKPGTFEEWKQVLRDKGVSPNQIKPVTVLDNKEKEDFFFNHLI